MPDANGTRRSRPAAAGVQSRTARRRARRRVRHRRRYHAWAAALTLIVGVTWYVVAPRRSGVRPALAQVVQGARPAPRLLTATEVAAGVARRLDAMRLKRVHVLERAAERQAAAVGEGRALAADRQPLPRDPEPLPGDAAAGVPE